MRRMSPPSQATTELATARTIIRFCLRLIILAVFAAFATPGFAPTMANLLLLASFYCIAFASWRRELVLGDTLGHWDEAAAYTFVGMLLLRSA
jgi:hypothetical protein